MESCLWIYFRLIKVDTMQPGINLTRWAIIGRLLLWGGYPYIFQILFLGIFLFLAYLGWNLMTPENVPDKVFAKTNLVNLLIWGLWWPGMVVCAVFFGRIWCAVCPLELVANVIERMGPGKLKLNAWLRSGALILVVYALIQMLVAGVHLHRVPAYTSLFLLGLLILAGVVGFLFKDRAFCRGFCPVGLLLSAYGRGSMLVVRSSHKEVCDSCDHHSCTDPSKRNRKDGRSCPSLLNPARLQKSNDCLVCGQCVKSCSPERNMGLYLRAPYHRADQREPEASWIFTLFIMLLSGFVAFELCTEWAAAKAMFLLPAKTMAGWLGLSENNGWIKGVWMLFILPLILWSIFGCAASLSGHSIRKLVLPLIPLLAAGHMAKGLAKISSWGGYLPWALEKPLGVENAQAIAAKTLAAPPHLISKQVVAILAIILVVAFAYLGLREKRLTDKKPSHVLTLLILGVALAELYLVWGWGFSS